MSSMPYNSKAYLDAKVSMKDHGTVDAGRQIQSPASAGSRGLAKTTQFSKDKTQMQLGQEAIAESMVDIRNIMNRIDGVNAPVQEDAGEKIANMAQNMTKDQFMSHADELGLTPEEAAEHYEKMSGGAHAGKFEDANDYVEEYDWKCKNCGHTNTFGMTQKDVDEYIRSWEEDNPEIVASGEDTGEGALDWQMNVIKDESGMHYGQPCANCKTIAESINEDAGSLTDQQKQGLQAIYKKYGNYEGYGNGDSLPIGNMEQVIDPGSTLWADDKEYKELDAYMKKMGYDGFSDAQDKDEDFFDNAMKEMPISSAMQDDISKVLGNDYYQKPDLAKAAKDYMSSLDESTSEDSGELARLKELSGIEENAKVNFSPEQIKQLMMWNKKYSVYSGKNGDELPSGLVKANTDSGITSDGYEENEVKQYEKMFGKEEFDWDDSQHGEFQEKSKITGGMMSDLEKIVGVGNADDEYTLAEIGEKILGMSFGDTYEEQYQPFPEGDEFDIEEDEDFEEVLGPLGFPEDETELFDAEYQGRKVPLNKPMRGDVKKFKVYVKDPKTGNVKKVNFGHGGTSAKRPTMRIRKSNPKARKSFRARHNCANPGPKTKARYWSCRKW